eukprot:TRINITY_DN17638_c0_g1_i1.p1 TRINITY_DN17638_c0_g1~~TRINITY_DN17638_c0_g1_i1.p1  ORF type:complete len:567 (-),score=90.88 TRINITY_DN17638_c0_g1_i1:119-1567(-)
MSASQKDDIDIRKLLDKSEIPSIDFLFPSRDPQHHSCSALTEDSTTSPKRTTRHSNRTKSPAAASSEKRRRRKSAVYTSTSSLLDTLRLDYNSTNILSKQGRHEICSLLPRYKVPTLNSTKLLNLRQEDESLAHQAELICCQTTSTYPRLSPDFRAGDPICDYYNVDLFERNVIIALSDGCNWGAGPKEAATRAAIAFNSYLSLRLSRIKHTKKAARLILRAISAAQQAILDRPQNKHDTGTTTLLGGVLLPILEKKTPKLEELRWAFVCGSVGDCKAFVWSAKKRLVTDITHKNRENALDASDCGGRLGNCVDGQPDLRNLQVYCHLCDEGDILFVTTDGIHDNCDPQLLGKKPSELSLADAQWKDLTDMDAVHIAKTKYREKLLTEIINNIVVRRPEDVNVNDTNSHVSPISVVHNVIEHCIRTTKESRNLMETRPEETLPEDYCLYPGKMDHTSVACIQVTRSYAACAKANIKRVYGTW